MFGLKDYLARLPSDVEPRDRITLAVLFDHADDAGLCWPSMPRIAALTGCDDRGARRSVQRIVALGLAVVAEAGGGRTSTRYRLNLTPTTTTRGQGGRATTTTRGPGGSAEGVHEVGQGGSRRQGSTTTTTPRSIKEASVEAASNPQQVATATAPAEPPQLELVVSEQPPLKQWEKAIAFCVAWNNAMGQANPAAKPGPKVNRLFAAAVDRFGPELAPLLNWCAADWKWSGANGSSRTAQAFFARDTIELVLADRRNTDAGTRKNPNDRKPTYIDAERAETERRKNYYANMDGGGD